MTTGDSSSSRNPSRDGPHRPRCRAIIALRPRIGVYRATASTCAPGAKPARPPGCPSKSPDTATAVACGRTQRTTARTSDTDAHHARDVVQRIHVRIRRPSRRRPPWPGCTGIAMLNPRSSMYSADPGQQQVVRCRPDRRRAPTPATAAARRGAGTGAPPPGPDHRGPRPPGSAAASGRARTSSARTPARRTGVVVSSVARNGSGSACAPSIPSADSSSAAAAHALSGRIAAGSPPSSEKPVSASSSSMTSPN